MRQIKFRVFDKNDGMFLVDGLVGTSKGMRVSSVLQIPEDCDPECYTLEPWEWEYSDDDVLMQFTGLKDKNGVEIYEGDIVRWGLGFTGSWDNESWHRYAVAELFPSLQFRIIYYIIGETGEKKETDNHVFEFGSFAYKETHKYLEVIGNIYQNPELLESK